MSKNEVISPELEELDRIYREGGLRRMAPPRIRYHDPACPHPGCSQRMEWIAFQLERFGNKEGICKPLVRSWWQGAGFLGRCPGCGGWIRFTTLRKEPLSDADAEQYPKLPDNWHAVAQIK
jgi:hypothetical protein